MNFARSLGISFFVLAVGCGGAKSSTAPTTGSLDNGADAGDTPPGPDPYANLQKVNLTTESFDVPPGQEMYRCQNFANPFDGYNVDIAKFEVNMPVGSHHMIMFFEPSNADKPLEVCSGSEFKAAPFGSTKPHQISTFPPGVAMGIQGSLGLRIQMHYLNTTQETIHANASVDMWVADPSTVENEAAVISFVNYGINLPPNQTTTLHARCASSSDDELKVISLYGHMHRHGLDFNVVDDSGNQVYDSTVWQDSVVTNYEPPMLLHKGDGLTWSCEFQNDTSSTIKLGESALTDEMCNLFGTYYPNNPGSALLCYTPGFK